MAKKVVFLSAGHGGTDPGAVAYGMKEKDINLRIMLSCRDELERHGLKVICSRIKDENDPVNSEVKEANASKANIAVSFHTNGGKGDGSETYYYSKSEEGKKLAELCEKHTKAIGQNSRGVKSGNHLHFISGTNMVAVLCECAFIDNDKDNNIIDTAAEQKKFGVSYAKAILEYFGIKYKAVTTSTKKYFARYNGTSGSIVSALNSLKITSTFAYRTKIAKANGIKDYSGTSSQNTKLLNRLKQGKLIKP